MVTQLQPFQVKGLEKSYEDIKQLRKNTYGIKIATWVTAISTLAIAIVGVITLIIHFLQK